MQASRELVNGALLCYAFPSMKRRRKRPYVLLEVMIAFTILVVCLAPLLHGPLAILKFQISSTEKAEISRLDKACFAEVKELLYKNQIPWEQFNKDRPKKKEKKNRVPDEESRVDVYTVQRRDEKGTVEARKFVQKIYYWTETTKEGQQGEEIRLINIRICFVPVHKKPKEEGYTFDHRVFVKKKTTSHTA